MNLPVENIYGHTKKLRYILNNIKVFIKDNSKNKKTFKILDFGCGNGSAVSQYIINLDERIEYHGVDFHPDSLNYARNHYGSNRAFFIKEVPQNTYDFDIFVYSDIIEHLDNPSEILKSHLSLLSKSGIIIGVVPNGYGPFEMEKRIDNLLKLNITLLFIKKVIKKIIGYKSREQHHEEIPYNSDSGHVQFFTKKSLFYVLDRSNYKVINFKNASLLGASFSAAFLKHRKVIEWNAKIADYLPYYLVSGWYFICKKND